MSNTTISVNGTVYDSRTGMPLREERGHSAPTNHSANAIHQQPQRSKTLNRRYVHLDKKAVTPVVVHSEPTPTISVHRTPIKATSRPQVDGINRFAKPAQSTNKGKVVADIAPAKHHIAIKAQQRVDLAKPQDRVLKPSDMLKRESIERATASMVPKASKKEVRQSKHGKFGRLASVGAASLAVLLLGAYLTYLNMPALSTRVAATQAGINASYPAYTPTGYSLNGPVAYQQNSVTMKFASNAGPQNYTLSQTHSDWDSLAVLDNYVVPQAGKNYTTTATGGLTIYSYGNAAVWVNNGILYTINGDANLSNSQIEQIATSL